MRIRNCRKLGYLTIQFQFIYFVFSTEFRGVRK